jgi:uncharacterized protein YqeY
MTRSRVSPEAKKRCEAAEAFTKGGRSDRADRERAEGGDREYLPAQLSDEEVRDLVATGIAEAGAISNRWARS